MRPAPVPLPRTTEDIYGSHLGGLSYNIIRWFSVTTQTGLGSSRCCLRGHNQAPFGPPQAENKRGESLYRVRSVDTRIYPRLHADD